MKSIIDGYAKLLKVVLTILMIGLIIPVSMQILSRYTGLIPRYIWTEEIARFCFVWIVLIGSMIAVRDGTHFDVDVLPHAESAIMRLISTLFVHGCMALVALIFLVYGYDFAILGSRQRSEIASLPMLSIYIAWPLAGLTWLIFLVEKIIEDFNGFRHGQKGHSP